ncbi:MAG TPA: quinolinate synthase NadA [Candidatus Dormibacteraeota bacterium]|nr:quinolinate synthase NadA [Candidatus Dormibacteraeota bacterium]
MTTHETMTPDGVANLQQEVRRLARERNAVILAHNYQVGEVQDVADFVGDSLGLAIEASKTSAETIVLCGVYFMAETAKILNPERRVLIPDVTAGCSLADSISAGDLRGWKAHHPGAVVVSYVNTTAEVKAESDYCVTSGNAEAVIRSIPEEREILFLPDMFLGSWLKEKLGRERMHIWMGECHVHAAIRPEEIDARVAALSSSELLIHPECGCTSKYVWGKAHGMMPSTDARVVSTEGMIARARESTAETMVVATETGILHRLQKEVPGKRFVAADDQAVCRFMKQITLENLHVALRDLSPEVDVPPEIVAKARLPIDRMLAIRP